MQKHLSVGAHDLRERTHLNHSLPGLNLILWSMRMRHIFSTVEQDFKVLLSRSFISLVPMVFILWQWYLESNWRFKKLRLRFLLPSVF